MANDEETFHELLELLADGVEANDEIPIWDVSAGQTKRITRAGLVGTNIVGGGSINTNGKTINITANGTVALQESLVVGVPGSTLYRPAPGVVRQKVETVALPSRGDMIVQADNSGRGLVLVYNSYQGALALFAVEGTQGSIIWGNTALFGTTNNSLSGKVNCFATGGAVYVQNGTAIGITLQVYVLL